MLSEWSAECGADDPVLVVPWSSSESELPEGVASQPHSEFIDLRENPYDLDHLPEAEQYPPLMQALRALNAARSPVFTAKCDAWAITDEDERNNLRFQLDLAADESPSGFASYIDLLWRERSIFANFHQHEQLLDRLSRRAGLLDHPNAMLDCIVRPAFVDLNGPQEGFAVSLYIKALGHDTQSTFDIWAAALDSIVALLRGRDFATT